MLVTIKDIAKKANVSIGTIIDRVINNKSRFSKKTKAHIDKIIEGE
ncbi:LacI family DNA-binding transcriptional regulator [Flavivirga rizhaonensis]|uniref:LacI family transcriptional regulator n=1 Tax=Flavivirga rizhaonensis TaxID=2559571 RepID=A0A4S1DTD5_9FLAO|nr:LacI family DNA-binding transcriptional regulator [Flavivirga rizhaonensis]TGV01199.1 LacI family transcriptional regulator [Flavivirga rizhaonensis]